MDSQQVRYCNGIKGCAKKLNLCPNYQPNPDAANSVTLSIVASANKRCVHVGDKANNEDSIISKITYAGKSTLITGDFELGKNPMKDFLKIAGHDLSSHIFRLSHHGSFNDDKGANQYEFLKAVGADYVFSSSGFKHGHPRCQIYDYYAGKIYGYYDAELPDNAVALHPYTCFNSDNKDDYEIFNTKKPIYVTSVYVKWLLGLSSKEYHVIVKFNITKTGHINAETVKVQGDFNPDL